MKNLEEVGLSKFVNVDVATLSGGQKQRVAIARSLSMNPKVMLFDEPTSALDPISTAKIEESVLELKKDYTIIMVTHNMRDAIAHGNRLIMMNDGKVVLDIKGEENKKLTVEKLLHQFEVVSGEEFASDKVILG